MHDFGMGKVRIIFSLFASKKWAISLACRTYLLSSLELPLVKVGDAVRAYYFSTASYALTTFFFFLYCRFSEAALEQLHILTPTVELADTCGTSTLLKAAQSAALRVTCNS